MATPDAAKSRLELLAEATHEALGDKTVKLLFGRENLKGHEKLRRIIWCHAPSSIEKADHTSGRVEGFETNAGGNSVGKRFRSFWLRIENAEIHIYAENDGATDRLFEALLNAIANVAPDARMSAGYVWPSDLPNEAGHNQRQPWIVLRCGFPLNVVEEEKQLFVVTGQEHDCGIITNLTDPFPPEGGFPVEE